MRFTTILTTIVSVASVALAQNSSMVVNVGGTGSGNIFFFNPNTITASNGTVITFKFSGNPGNHSITQSTFANPCQPMAGGFDSGWVFIASDSNSPTWNLTITNDSQPIWFFCKQLAPAPHCVAGMVGAINAPSSGSNTFAAFQKAAESSSGTPGQGVGQLVGVGASASAIPGPIASPDSFAGSPAVSGASASATAPSGGSSGSGAPSPSGSGTSNSAVALSVGSGFVALFAGLAAVALA